MDQINYDRIATAINFLRNNFRDQPDLDEVAAEIHLSPYHFQKLFSEWAGVSPKKFLQYLTIDRAKQILRQKQATNVDAAFETGLSGTGRLHDLFISMEGMTPGEYKNGGQDLVINYSFSASPFGEVLIASTPKGICYMAFTAADEDAVLTLKNKFPNASIRPGTDKNQADALSIFARGRTELRDIKLHLKGSAFQLKVWETLLRIPFGNLDTYGSIARQIGKDAASRAVGTAIGDNPIAYLIPCHRVIQAGGKLGGYHWGIDRKAAILGWEAAHIESMESQSVLIARHR